MGKALPQPVEKYEKYEEKVIKRWPGTSKMFNDYQASFVCVCGFCFIKLSFMKLQER